MPISLLFQSVLVDAPWFCCCCGSVCVSVCVCVCVCVSVCIWLLPFRLSSGCPRWRLACTCHATCAVAAAQSRRASSVLPSASASASASAALPASSTQPPSSSLHPAAQRWNVTWRQQNETLSVTSRCLWRVCRYLAADGRWAERLCDRLETVRHIMDAPGFRLRASAGIYCWDMLDLDSIHLHAIVAPDGCYYLCLNEKEAWN